jgi:two-component system response regulator
MMSSARILLVDDDPNDVDVALRAIRRENLPVEVSVASDGREALDALGIDDGDSAHPPAPCAVFVDLKMPRIDGWELLQRLRANPYTKSLPVIVVSWSNKREDIDRCYALGANSFLLKRVNPANPGGFFVEAVRYWVGLNQVASTPAKITAS